MNTQVTVQQPWTESETGRSQPSQLVVGVSEPSQVNTKVTVQQPWAESETEKSQLSQLVVGVYESIPSHNMKADITVQESQEDISSCMTNAITLFYAMAGGL